jgi:TPR repeat protein
MQPQPKAEDEDLSEVLGVQEKPVIGFDAPPPSIDELVAEGNGDALVELGAAYRIGTPHTGRDAFKALECFEAASRLGSAEAEYLVGVALMDGRGIAADQPEGAKRLRSAAQRGSLRAKIYVANMYETGVCYQADREKADVWYRNVARAANIEAAPDTPAFDAAMAELGCVRHCLKLVADDALPTKDRQFYLKKAKAMGYQHKLAASKRENRASLIEAVNTPAPMEAKPAPTPAPAPAAEPEPAKTAPKTADNAPEPEPALAEQWTWGPGLVAFVGALFSSIAASGAAWLALEGSKALAAQGRPLPLVDGRHDFVFWAVLFTLGVLPAASTYRARVFAIACVAGLAGGWGAFGLWNVQHFVHDRLAQGALGGLGAFLLTLLVLGLLGGTRAYVRKKEKRGARAKRSDI